MATPTSRPIDDLTLRGALDPIKRDVEQIKREMVKQAKPAAPVTASGSFIGETAHVKCNDGPFWHAGKAQLALHEDTYTIDNATYGEDPPSWIRTSLDRIILEPGYYSWQLQLGLQWDTDAGCPPTISVYDGSPLAWTVPNYARIPLASGMFGYQLLITQPPRPIDDGFDWLCAEAELKTGDYRAVTELWTGSLTWLISRLG